MAVLCDTAMVPVRDSAELWVDVVSELFVPLECVPHHGAAFHGRLRAGSLGPIRMCAMEVSPHTVKRTPRPESVAEHRDLIALLEGGARSDRIERAARSHKLRTLESFRAWQREHESGSPPTR